MKDRSAPWGVAPPLLLMLPLLLLLLLSLLFLLESMLHWAGRLLCPLGHEPRGKGGLLHAAPSSIQPFEKETKKILLGNWYRGSGRAGLTCSPRCICRCRHQNLAETFCMFLSRVELKDASCVERRKSLFYFGGPSLSTCQFQVIPEE